MSPVLLIMALFLVVLVAVLALAEWLFRRRRDRADDDPSAPR